ncbi:MAG TPA: phage holin family protein [Balneolales bacterium]|nr:phage holin family protein [Balneolales bacterium]
MSEREGHNDGVNKEAFRRLSSELRRYVEKRIELIATEMNGQFSFMASVTVLRTVGLVILLFGVLFLLFALAWYLGDLLGSISLGFLLASVPLFVAGITLVLLRPRRLLHRVRLQFFRQFMQMVSYITPQDLPDKTDVSADSGSQSLKKRENRHE